jgi:serine/threonine protein kinase
MTYRLEVIAGPDQGRVFPLPEADTLLLGRSRATETRLTDPHVSRVHCHVQVTGNQVVVTDFDSAGGTFINDQPVTHGELKPGEVIRIGATCLTLLTDDPEEATTLPLPFLHAELDQGSRGEMVRLAGQTFSHYFIGPVLAEGGSGLVFHARDTQAERPVALKVLWPGLVPDERHKERFVRVMRGMLSLRHPNLVAVLGVGQTGAYCWVALEYIDGESLARAIERRISVQSPLDWRYGLRVAVHIARALEFAGQHQLVHGNLAPANILVRSATQEAVLGDLMLAQALEAPAPVGSRPGARVGDVRYMAPERTYGSAGVDARADIYSLGAVVYALLAARPPFTAGSVGEMLVQIRQAEPLPPRQFQPSLPDAFERVVLTMLAKRPADRYQTAAALLTELESFAADGEAGF